MTSQLAPADAALVRDLARGAKESVDEVLASLLGCGSTVVSGRFEALHVYIYEPKTLDVSGLAGLCKLRFGSEPSVEVLRVGAQAKLRVLDCKGQPLTELDLSGCSALEDFDAAACSLRDLRLPASAPLASIDVRGNALASLDLRRFTTLQSVWAGSQPLAELHLPLAKLRTLRIYDTRLEKLPDFDARKLEWLSVDGIPLGILDLSRSPKLETLSCNDCGLDTLDLTKVPLLEQLSCDDNALRTLDCRSNPRLSSLDVKNNPLGELDLTGCSRLEELTIEGVPSSIGIRADELTRHLVPALRKHFKIPREAARPYVLHAKAREYNWDDGVAGLLRIIRDPACDLATALLVYWNSEPDEFTGYASPKDGKGAERKTLELLIEIEQRVAKGQYKTARIPYDPTDQDGVDLTRGSAFDPKSDKRRIPKAMFRRVEQ